MKNKRKMVALYHYFLNANYIHNLLKHDAVSLSDLANIKPNDKVLDNSDKVIKALNRGMLLRGLFIKYALL